jgi:hypothetical protein
MRDKNPNETIRIELTPEQSEKIKMQIGKSASSIEFTVQELEARITPFGPFVRLAGNHNETLLVEER